MKTPNIMYDETGLPTWFLIGSNSLFFPIWGDEERTLINWLQDLKEEYKFNPILITAFPEIEGYDDNIPFETVRLSAKVEYNRNLIIYVNKIRNENIDTDVFIPVLKDRFDIDLEDSSQWGDIKNLVADRFPFSVFLAVDDWADEQLTPLIMNNLNPEHNPDYIRDIVSVKLSHEVYGAIEKDTNCDLFLHSSPYEYIRNENSITFYESAEENKIRLFLYPKPQPFTSRKSFHWNMLDWNSRPYDYIYYYPTISKGSPIIVNLALNQPNKKFLVWKADDLIPKSYEDYGFWVEKMEKIDNIDIIEKGEDFTNDFLRKGKFILYPSILDSIGWLPVEAGMEGTIPICSDTSFLRHAAGPFAEFVYDDSITFNPNNLILDKTEIHNLNFLEITQSWMKRIDFLDDNPLYVARLWDNLRHLRTYADNRYESQREWFRQAINKNIYNWIEISDKI